MAFKVTQEQLERWKGQLQSAAKRVSLYKEKADGVIERAVQTVEISAAAFGMGVLNGKTGGIDILGVPVDLGLGLGLNLLGFLGVGGRYVDHLHNLGNGALASFLSTLGVSVGKDWKAKSGQGALASTSVRGSLGSGSRRGMSLDQELADLVNAQ